MSTTVPCPNCRAPVEWSAASPYRPFCSKRCRMADLNDWFTERHSIPGAELDEELVGRLADPGTRPANED
ncbi:DNA gyrase inhibitor YacG [Alkalilimnicola sp. S0819]|uniref:DNA gyrase inhibitor YacG n=1 Tax=Alkalilimnicola sp. S0819 TaxID=2613922 RepID=UPI00126254CE|nr:DNA gyrase inhibitor YacG [Alkalilimnicola sp. S0819]KAB7623130.1 DNA gyrase inhibitor YacG [Alkalilimnicola sp. S0819]MPQ16974.1 DNA gyrase inhibitor YacG [Alkalilimnicola sp. S0819]